MVMKRKPWKSYLLWIALTEEVGALSGWLSRGGAQLYRLRLVKPPLSPPGAVFPVVWTVLFALMGVGAARVSAAPASAARTRSLRLFWAQLAFNFFWSILFFNLQRFGLALIWLAVLWTLILRMILAYREVDRAAAWLQLPYLLWVTFAAYLNLGVWVLN